MVYLDHASTTPMLPEAVDAYVRAASQCGNASSLHASGRKARRVAEEARELIAQHLGARPSEVIFTGGGTESDNLAVKGIYWSRVARDAARTVVLCSAVEHHAVLDAVMWLASHHGAEVRLLPVDDCGRVDSQVFRDALERNAGRVALATVMWANNEVGAVQPIPEFAAIAAEHGVPLHTDAVQAVGQIPVSFAASGAAALTMTGHKIGGPHRVGALLLGRDVSCTPLLHGGGQERSIHSGTLDVPGVAALAAAVELAVGEQVDYAKRLQGLRDSLIVGLRAAVPDVIVNGPWSGLAPGRDLDSDMVETSDRLPGNVHVSFPGCEGDALLMLLDAVGIDCSTGSACTAGVAQPSHVLLAMGADPVCARSSLRFSLGHTSTMDDVSALLSAIGPAVARARQATKAAARLR